MQCRSVSEDLTRCFWQVPAADVIDWVYSLQVLPLAVHDPSSAAVNKGIIH
jgi:hypothetical protein